MENDGLVGEVSREHLEELTSQDVKKMTNLLSYPPALLQHPDESDAEFKARVKLAYGIK